MADDVRIKVTAPGAQKATGDIRKVAQAEKSLGDAAEKSGRRTQQSNRKTGQSMGRLGQAASSLSTKIKGLFAGLGVTMAIRRAYAVHAEELRKRIELTNKAIEAERSLMALSMLAGERKETREFVWKAAVESGRPIEQVAPAYYTLLGGTAGMDRERQMGLFQQSLLMGKTDPRASIESLVNLFTTVASQQKDLTPQQIGNLLSKTIEQAKSSPSEMAAYLPTILSAAVAGDVPTPQAMAAFSFATRKGGSVAKSGTAVTATMLGLLAPSPDVKKAITRFGFPAEGDLVDRMQWLAERGPELPPELQAALGGRRGIQMVSAIGKAPREFAKEQEILAEAEQVAYSLITRKLQEMFAELPGQRVWEQGRRLDIAIEKEQQDPQAQFADVVQKMADYQMRKIGRSDAVRAYTLWKMRVAQSVGFESPLAGGLAEVEDEALVDLLGEGYPGEQLVDVLMPVQMAGGLGQDRATIRSRFREILRARGIEPLQGQIRFEGGTHYHQNDKRDPAGRPRTPVGAN